MGFCRKNSCYFKNVIYLGGNLKKKMICDILNIIIDFCGKKRERNIIKGKRILYLFGEKWGKEL